MLVLTISAGQGQETATLTPQRDIQPLFDGLQQSGDAQFKFQPLPAVPGLKTESPPTVRTRPQTTPRPLTTPRPQPTSRPIRIRVQKEELITAAPSPAVKGLYN